MHVRHRLILLTIVCLVALLTVVGPAFALIDEDRLVSPPAPSGPPPEEWLPPDYYKDKPELAQALKETYEDDYNAILEPGAMAVTQDADEKPKVHMWGILDNGQAIPTDVEWARYRNGQLIDSAPAREVATAPATNNSYWHASIEPDDALYVGYVAAEAPYTTGLKAQVNVSGRHTLRDYYLIYMQNSTSNHDGFALEIAEYAESIWRPLLHIKYSDGSEFVKWYTNKPVALGWHEIKFARNSSTGLWNIYLDSAPLDYNLYWPTSTSRYYPATQVEAFYETASEAVHDPATHHAFIYLRLSDYSTWSLWTDHSWGPYEDDGHYGINPYYGYSISDKYRYIQFQHSPDFDDWMLRK